MKKQKVKYCTVCGKELKLIKEEVGYDENTGKKLFINTFERCDVNDLDHKWNKFIQRLAK